MGRKLSFTPEEDSFIKENCGVMKDKDIADHLGKTKRMVEYRRKQLGIIKVRGAGPTRLADTRQSMITSDEFIDEALKEYLEANPNEYYE